MRLRWWLITAVSFLRPLELRAQEATNVRVVVRDTGGVVLPDALVTVMPEGLRARTGADGAALFPRVAVGPAVIHVRRLGYRIASVPLLIGTRTDSLSVRLETLPATLQGVVVEDSVGLPWLADFEARRRRGTGRYVTLEELRRAHGSDLDAVLRRRVPGVRIGGANDLSQQAYSLRGPNSIGGQCQIMVFIDGIREPTGNVAALPLSLIGAVEYYTPSQVPVQYKVPASITPGSGARGGSASCGVLLLWSR